MGKPLAWTTARPIPATRAARSTAANAAHAVNALRLCVLRASMTQPNTIYNIENMKRNYELYRLIKIVITCITSEKP